MTCKCEKKNHETDDADGVKTCPEGQSFDPSSGKCKAKEQFGDPGSSETGDLASSGADSGEVQKVTNHECPEGHSYDATTETCQPTSPEVPAIADTKADISKETKRIQQLETQLAEFKMNEKKPTAQVSSKHSQDSIKNIREVADEYIDSLRKYGKYEFEIPTEVLRAINVAPAQNTQNSGMPISEAYRGMNKLGIQEAWNRPNKAVMEGYSSKTLKEAVVISGTHATQDLDTDVAIVPGGISFVPVFQFAKTKEIEAGSDRARFFKATIPGNQSQTVGTTATEATQTISAIEVTPSTITGTYLVGDFDEIENSPFDLLQVIVEGSAANYEDFVATDMLTTVSAEGTLTPGLWIRGDTGATITTSDNASVVMDETGVAFGREYLENQGYLRGGVKPVLFLHPKQWRQLITSTNVTSLATRSVPDIWLKAQLEQLFGVQLVVTNAVEAVNNTTIDAFNAYMCIPKHSYGIGIKRDVTVKMHEIPEDNEVRVNTTWRTKSGIIDATSIVRISTTQ